MGQETRVSKQIARTLIQEGFTYDFLTGSVYRRGVPLGAHRKQGYTRARVRGVLYRGHVLAWILHYGEPPVAIIDHINGDKSDNRISNLRLSDSSSNGRNRQGLNTNNTSGVQGVSYSNTRGKWVARIRNNSGKIVSRRFSRASEAITQRLDWEKEFNYKTVEI